MINEAYSRIKSNIAGIRRVTERSPEGLVEALHSSYTHFLLINLESTPEATEPTVQTHMHHVEIGLKNKELSPAAKEGLDYLTTRFG